MSLEALTDKDFEGKGVGGQPDVPGLSADEMQKKVEEIALEVLRPKINEIIEYIKRELATQNDLNNVVIKAGSVTSVFGRAGDVTAKSGDYTPEMVGAAPERHKDQHISGEDAITPSDIKAAEENHSHGNLNTDGTVKDAVNGDFVVIGTNEEGNLVIEGKSAVQLGILKKAEEVTNPEGVTDITVTLQENKRYDYTGVTSLNMTVAAVSCRGRVVFGDTVGTVTVSGFAAIGGADDIAEATAGDIFEFNCESYGSDSYIIFNKWRAAE